MGWPCDTLLFFSDNGLLSFLDFVALNPHKSWRYVPDDSLVPISIPPPSPPTLISLSHPLPKTYSLTRTVAPIVHPAVDVDASSRNKSNSQYLPIDVDPANVVNPLLHENKMVLSIINNEVHPIRNASKSRPPTAVPSSTAPSPLVLPKQDSGKYAPPSNVKFTTVPPVVQTVELVPYFYGEVPGDETVGKEINFCELKCHKCLESTSDNVSFYEHMKSHLFEHRLPNMTICRYCILQFPEQESYNTHIKEVLPKNISQMVSWLTVKRQLCYANSFFPRINTRKTGGSYPHPSPKTSEVIFDLKVIFP